MKISPWLGALLVALLAVFAVAPLTYPGFFESQSGFLPSFRVQHLSPAGLVDRVDPVRSEGGLAYWLAWPFLKLSGVGVTAVKWGYGLSFVLGALAVYSWSRRRLGSEGGALAAVVYTYLPWHLATVYLRGAYAEAWLWVLWPALLLAWEARLRHGTALVRLAGVALGAATLLVQPGLTFLFLVLLVPYAVAVWRVRWWPARIVAVLLAMGLLVFGAWVVAMGADGQALAAPDGFLYPFQLLSASWDQGLAGGALPYQLGVVAVGLTIAALALWALRDKQAEALGDPGGEPASTFALRPALAFWLVALIAVLFFTLRASAPLWRAFHLGSLVAYPWQLLALAGLPLAFLAGSVTRLDRRLAERPVWAGLAALAILASYAYLAPRFTRVDPGAQPVAEFQPAGAVVPPIQMLVVDVSPAAGITSTVTLTLTWQALATVPEDYTVFVHLLANGTKIAQSDAWPCGGECPTSGWRPGVIVVDRHPIALPPGAPPGPYRLAVGLYLQASGERVPVVGRDDSTVYVDVR
jgi:hypothetical protein